ncbi:MAG TPA: hypothetical protein VKG92_02580 [Flavobacteriales bacterium]|nr:hypothetical protein [Flavobacteriales bacterium]
MELIQLPQLIITLVGLLPNIFMVVVCSYYLRRRPGTDSVMLVIGTGLLLLLGIFNFVYWQIIMPMRGFSATLIPNELMSSFISISYFVAEVLLGLGLLFLINKELRRPREASFGPPRM